MRKLYFFYWALLLVDGVFGDEIFDVSLSVMEGDPVTLNPQTEIPEDASVEWWLENTRIAKMNKAAGTSYSTDERFRDRLKLDHQTGSLTITNIKTTDYGLYKLQIRSSRPVRDKVFKITVRGDVVTVSVMEGDTVPLHTGVTDIQRDQILWKFEDQVLNGADARWSNSYLNDKTGDLTIRNIRRDQYGDYEVEINTSSLILHSKFRIKTLAVFGDDVTVSVMEGDSVTLNPQTEIPEDDSAQWWFGDKIIATMNKADGRFSTSEGDDVGFNGRLNLDHQTGSLTITHSRTNHTGLYKLKIRGKTEKFKIFSVTVTVSDTQTPDPGVSPGVSPGVVVGIVAVLLVVFAAVVIYYRRKISELQGRRTRKSKYCSGWRNPMLRKRTEQMYL